VLSSKKQYIFGGSPADLPTADLPSYGDVARYFSKLELEGEKDRNVTVHRTAEKLEEIWKKANSRLPLKDKKVLLCLLKRFCEKCNAWRGRTLSAAKRAYLTKTIDNLCDISSCSCLLQEFPCQN
jgi:hypothetical protein